MKKNICLNVEVSKEVYIHFESQKWSARQDKLTSQMLSIYIIDCHVLYEWLPLNEYLITIFCVGSKTEEYTENLSILNNQQYKINNADICFVMNFFLVYSVGECSVLNMNIEQGERPMPFTVSSLSTKNS